MIPLFFSPSLFLCCRNTTLPSHEGKKSFFSEGVELFFLGSQYIFLVLLERLAVSNTIFFFSPSSFLEIEKKSWKYRTATVWRTISSPSPALYLLFFLNGWKRSKWITKRGWEREWTITCFSHSPSFRTAPELDGVAVLGVPVDARVFTLGTFSVCVLFGGPFPLRVPSVAVFVASVKVRLLLVSLFLLVNNKKTKIVIFFSMPTKSTCIVIELLWTG